MILKYKEWRERDETFNILIDLIYRINREGGNLEELLKIEYKKYLKNKGEKNNENI